MIRRWFGQPDSEMVKRARLLVVAARVRAGDFDKLLLEQFPVLKEVISQPADLDYFDFVLTIAGVFVAITRLRELDLVGDSQLLANVDANIIKWKPEHGHSALQHCMSFFKKNYDLLAKTDVDPKFIAMDALGYWIVWEVLGRAPKSKDEWSMVRVMGRVVTHEFLGWWSSPV